MRSATITLVALVALSADGNARAAEGGPPAPPSPVIARLEWAPAAEITRQSKDSDNFPVTWADDDALYTTFGDGTGFVPKVPAKLGLGFARVTGMPPSHRGENIRSAAENTGQGMSGKKGSGILMVDGVLYLWLFHADEKGGKTQLAWSTDHARTWAFADWMFDEFGLCAFINYGRNYEGARDGFVYAVAPDSPKAHLPADRFVLMRVSKERIRDRSAYEFLRDAAGGPTWTSEIGERGAVFSNPGRCLRSGISYNAALKRYLWWQHIPNRSHPRGDMGDTRFEGGFGIYDAPEPWGPWTTAYYTEKWDVGPGERAEFPTKWMSADGRTMHLVFSGDDSFAVRKATLTLAGDETQ